MQEALSEFIAECEELTQKISANLSIVEKGDSSEQTIDEIYRHVHTIKGSAQLFGFKGLGQLAHAVENCLEPIRKSKSKIPAKLIDVIMTSLNVFADTLEVIGKSGSEPDLSESIDKTIASLSRDFPETPELLVPETAAKKSEVVKIRNDSQIPMSDAGSVRVNVALLNKLMNLAGEMVLVRNQVLQYSQRVDDFEFLQMSQRFDLVTSELQEEIMKTRMQPIGNILEPFQRVVRELARDLGKKISLEVVGKQTELDKTLLEAVKDPLNHILRNSADHGLELPAERQAKGKPESGNIVIRSYHEGGLVIIEVSDDGRGLDREKILQRALESGLIAKESVARISDREIHEMIFHPGFSTAKQVTSVSGRGVGMDVVRTNVERVGGTVEISSIRGKGTKIRLRIPLTLAIVPVLIVSCDGGRFAVPQVKLVELVRVNETNGGIENLQGQPMYRLRGDLLPLVRLRDVLRTPNANPDVAKKSSSEDVNIVVLNAEGKQFGLIVDQIQDTADIVVKPLTQFLKSLKVYSGATIMGDGAVALILDIIGLAGRTKIFAERKTAREEIAFNESAEKVKRETLQEFLLFRTSTKSRHAVPLCLVHRLEEFPRSSIEYTGDQPVMRYRDSILPLLNLNKELGYSSDEKNPRVAVIVIKKNKNYYGIIVDEILDIVTVTQDLDSTVRGAVEILGNLIINDEVCVVVDILRIIENHSRRMSEGDVPSGIPEVSASQRGRFKILIAEDSNFFRKQLFNGLKLAGFNVDAAGDGSEALEKVRANDYNAVVSDIEMPNLNGLEFAREVRKLKKSEGWPLVAVTTKFSQNDIADGLNAGFDVYLEKLRLDEIIDVLDAKLKIKEAA